MKKVLLVLAVVVIGFSSCSKDETTEPEKVNNFKNTYWEYSTTGIVLSLDFIGDTECKWGADLSMFTPDYTFYNYTFDNMRANITDKQTGKTEFTCDIDGNNLTIVGRSEVFKRIR